MSTVAVSPLRQRMIEDVNARKLRAGTQRSHIHGCKQFAAFLKRSPDTATSEDIRSQCSALIAVCEAQRSPCLLRYTGNMRPLHSTTDFS